MGYSCNAYASLCLDALNELTQTQSHSVWNDRGSIPSNGYLNTQGIPCFYERGREQRDGAITGQCFKWYKDENYSALYMPCGYMRISAEGIERFPGLSKAVKLACNKRARIMYQEIYKRPYESPKEHAAANRYAYLTDNRDPRFT